MAVELGVYSNNLNPPTISHFEAAIGRKVDCAMFTGGGFSSTNPIEDAKTACRWQRDSLLPQVPHVTPNWSMPICTKYGNATMQMASENHATLRDIWVTQAGFLKDARRDKNGKCRVRIAWEFNLGFPWQTSNPTLFRSAFRNMVAAYRSVRADGWLFSYCPNYGQSVDLEACYPGDDVVDAIELDWYWKTQYEGTNPTNAWNTIKNNRYGMDWLVNFANQRGKLKGVAEFGFPGNQDLAAPVIPTIRDYLVNNDFSWALYWNSEEDTNALITGGSTPNTLNAFKSAFTVAALAGTPTSGGDTGGGTTPVPATKIIQPYDALEDIRAYMFARKGQTITETDRAYVEDRAYWPGKAAGLRNDGVAYTGPSLVYGDTTAVTASLNAAQSELVAVKSSLSTATTQISALQANVNKLNSDLTAQKAATTTAVQDLTAARTQVTTLTGQLSTAQGSLTAAQTNLTAAQTAKAAAEAALTTANQDLSEARARIAVLEDAAGEGGLDAEEMIALRTANTVARDALDKADKVVRERKAAIAAGIAAAEEAINSAEEALAAAKSVNQATTAP